MEIDIRKNDTQIEKVRFSDRKTETGGVFIGSAPKNPRYYASVLKTQTITKALKIGSSESHTDIVVQNNEHEVCIHADDVVNFLKGLECLIKNQQNNFDQDIIDQINQLRFEID